MGQPIDVRHTVVGDVAIFDTDRSITGQDGAVYSSLDEASAGDDFPADLARRIFSADASIDHVFVASNDVVVRRRGGWSDQVVAAVSRVVRDFFLFYPEAGD